MRREPADTGSDTGLCETEADLAHAQAEVLGVGVRLGLGLGLETEADIAHAQAQRQIDRSIAGYQHATHLHLSPSL